MNSTTSEQFRHILVIEDRKARRSITLEESTYSVGRDAKNVIVLYDNQVSRHHATLLRIIDYKTNQSLYRIIDGDLQGKRSTNGLIINGKTCLSHELKHGDTIRFGGKAKAVYHVLSSSSPDFDLLKSEEKTAIQKPNPPQPPQASQIKAEEIDKSTLSLKNKELEDLSQEELVRLASFPELSPNPIIEMDSLGKLTYLNSAASLKFKEIQQNPLDHPILSGLLSNSNNRQGGLFVREVKIGTEIFEQYVHYLSDAKLIRSYIFDYTKRKQSETALKECEERYQLLLEQITEGVALVDILSQRILLANSAYSQMLGYSLSELLQLTLPQIVDIEHQNLERQLVSLDSQQNQLVGNSIYQRKDGSPTEVKVKISKASYQTREVYCFVVQESHSLAGNSDADIYSVYDPVTSLPNRSFFLEHLSTAIANAKRHHDLIALLLLEINPLPELDPPLTEEETTDIFKQVGQSLRNTLRAGDTVARWDQKHLAILLHRIFQVKDIEKIINRIITILEEKTPTVYLNLGVSVYPTTSTDVKTLIKHTQEALEDSKNKSSSSHNYSFYHNSPKSPKSNLIKLQNHLKKALDKEQFSLYYQPLANINAHNITGVKVSLYWAHPDLGLVPPEKFYPLAEQTGLIIPIGEWILDSVCKQNQDWQSAILAPIPISFDLPSRLFYHPNFLPLVSTTLEKYSLVPHLLELNLNTQCLSQDEVHAHRTMEQLQEIGVRVSLQDFGLGPSPLEYLHKYHFYRLKINQSLVKNLTKTNQHEPIIAALITLANGVKMKVVAEGVETESQVQILQKLNCDEIQGSWFSKPLTSKDATKLLQSVNSNSSETPISY